MDSAAERAIAIVGLGAILPDAPNVPAFWSNITGKRYSIIEVPVGRWSVPDYYDPDPSAPDKSYSKIGSWVQGFQFNWKEFRIPPKVVAVMDEGQQWAVTITAQALADYGYPGRPLDLERTAVVLGTAMGGEMHYLTNLRIAFPEYARAIAQVEEFQQLPAPVRESMLRRWREVIARDLPPVTEDSMPGELPNIVSGRVANVFGFRGPNFITDAACASSFAAVEAAVDLLNRRVVDVAITGGVDRNMGASTFVKFCKIGALSASGTRPFGEGADGFVMGEGAGVFLLKRLEDAEQDGDRVYAVIRGVGASSDGRGKGITAPNPAGQKLAIRRAWEAAGLDPATATLIEAHGTSTRVGDVAEVESLSAVFGGAPRGGIALGSVKSNIGHLKAGAGAAGMLKTVLALHHQVLPPTLNAERPNPNIDFPHTAFYLNHDCRDWLRPNSSPRRAGVSAYGFGGTNFHLVLEEHIPGALTRKTAHFTGASVPFQSGSNGGLTVQDPIFNPPASQPSRARPTNPQPFSILPFRGILAIGAAAPQELATRVDGVLQHLRDGWTTPVELPSPADLAMPERLVIDFGEQAELFDRLTKARKGLESDAAPVWKALQAQGIFRGRGARPGKLAFLFPGQGSQYLNMGRELASLSPVVADVFADADRVMTPILGRPLTEFIFLDSQEEAAVKEAELNLMQTAITQPAMLTLDIALFRLLQVYGFFPDVVVGHSLGEYAALIASGIMPFADALEAAAARGREMTAIQMDDNGWMAAVMAPLEVVQKTLAHLDGYAVAANINSYNQCVIGGESQAVEKAIQIFETDGYQARRIPVSHAFHTRIVAPASDPMRQVLDRLHISTPELPIVANVTGEFYPTQVEEIKDLLQKQIASPVQWVKGLETLYAAGARTFLEVGPKKALKGFVDDVLGAKPDVVSLFSNHPKTGELASFNQALCGLYAAGYGLPGEGERQTVSIDAQRPASSSEKNEAGLMISESGEKREVAMPSGNGFSPTGLNALGQAFTRVIQEAIRELGSQDSVGAYLRGSTAQQKPYDRNEVPKGSVVISGTGLGLPGAEKPVMDPQNAVRILQGEQFVDLIPERFRKLMLDKKVIRLVKSEDGQGRFETLNDPGDVIRLAGRPGSFNLSEEYGVPEKLVEALDITTQLAMAAGLDALREAGIPLIQTYRKTTTGKFLPDRWMLPEALRDETGVIFASAFPGGDRFADELTRYYTWQGLRSQLEALEDLTTFTSDPVTMGEIQRRMSHLRQQLERQPYEFDRRFLFRILAMGHSQFAEYIGARGPNTQINAACASTAQGLGLAEDWIRTGRCRRVIVIAADYVTGDHLMEWVGAGFLATGAVATDDRVEEAVLPFDRRRHGTIMGMGACALVVETQDALEERGMRGIVELLSSETNNSAFHGTRLDVNHIARVMDHLLASAERRFGLQRHTIASQLVFMSHETYTPARGGSASAEIVALRHTFGEAASDVVIANTKGFTGHAMGVGVEDVIAVKILEYGIVPPVPNFKEVDPELGLLNLSRGGRYPVQFALHLAAGFGSQIAMTLTRRIPGGLDRVDDRTGYNRWLAELSGLDRAELEVVKRVLRVKAEGTPGRHPAPSRWQYGTGPIRRAPAADPFAGFQPNRSPAVTAPAKAPVVPVVPTQDPEPAPTVPAVHRAEANSPVATPTGISPVFDRDEGRGGENLQPMASAQSAAVSSLVSLSAQPALALTPQPPAVDPITAKVVEVVAAKTGYPAEMLELDLDLEADLGVDTVKQAETFLALREAFGIPAQENLQLRDYPTLAHVIGFVRKMRPDLIESGPRPAVGGQAGGEGTEQPVVEAVSQTPACDPIAEKVLVVVAEKTGYPAEMLELDLDLEADLGVDTVKQAETFLALREAFGIPTQENLQLRDYPTLGHVIGFVRKMRPDLTESSSERAAPTPSASEMAGQAAPAGVPLTPMADPIMEKVLEVVAEKTGYPVEMLELDLDLEADLGVDTVKQAETFLALREAFNIPKQESLQLRDYPTLGHVIGFVRKMRPDLTESGPLPAVGGQAVGEGTEQPVVEAVSQTPAAPAPIPWSFEAADRFPRRVARPSLRPPLELCKPTGVIFTPESRVVVRMDAGGVGHLLVDCLKAFGVTALVIEAPLPPQALEEMLKGWLEEGPIQGVYWLPALDLEAHLEDLDLKAWRELTRSRVKDLYLTMKALYTAVVGSECFLVSATRLDGLHGYGAEGAAGAVGGGVVGFTKAYKRECSSAFVKAVDFAPEETPERIADLLIAETLSDPGVVEVGCRDEERFTVTLVEGPAVDGQPGMDLNPSTVFIVTGAAGSVTSAIITDLAAASGGVFYLLDLAPPPNPADPHIALFRSDREALKNALIEAARASGDKPTPARIDKQIAAVERQSAALQAIEAVEAAGGKACYHSVDLLDGPAVAAVVEDIRQRYGRIDVLVHAAGIEISHTLPDKDAKQFDLVFDVKADGFFNLLSAAQGMPLGATIVFSSVAGRFGNAGQTDYSAANDLLCKLTSSLRRWRPETRGIAIDWTAWGEIGMATRGSIPKIMEMAGIDMLPPASGVPVIRRELTAGGFRGEIVVGGRLGILTQEWDPSGGLDLEKVNRWREAQTPYGMIGEVKSARLFGGLEVETTLDPQVQPFLYDHAMDGTPLLPGVMGTEAFAQAASLLAPGYRVAAVMNESFQAPFKFYRNEAQTLYLSVMAEPDGEGNLLARATLSSRRQLAGPDHPLQEKVHFTAEVRLTSKPAKKLEVAVSLPEVGCWAEMGAEEIYKIYFHGPAYRVLEKVCVGGDTAVGQLKTSLPPNAAPEEAVELIAPRLIELCFQTAGIWEIKTKGRLALPLAIGLVEVFCTPDEARKAQAGEGRLYALVQAFETGAEDELSFDAQVADESGSVLLSLRGYRTVALPGRVAG